MEEQGDLGNSKPCELNLIYPTAFHGSTNKQEWIKNTQASSLLQLNPSLCRDASCWVTPVDQSLRGRDPTNLVQPFACQHLPVQLAYFWGDTGCLPLERLIKLGCLIYQISPFVFARPDPKCFKQESISCYVLLKEWQISKEERGEMREYLSDF